MLNIAGHAGPGPWSNVAFFVADRNANRPQSHFRRAPAEPRDQRFAAAIDCESLARAIGR